MDQKQLFTRSTECRQDIGSNRTSGSATFPDPVSAGTLGGSSPRFALKRPFLMATVVLVNLAFLAFLVMKPVPQKTIAMLDNVGLTGAILLAGLIPLVMTLIAGAKRSLAPGYFRPALFLSLGILAFGIGEVIWSYYEVILHRETPFPSWADAGYLFTYPFLGIGILSLPARPLTALRRIRVIFDGLIVVAALFTFSWSFVLGPTVLKASETLVAKVLGAAYPGGDLLLLFLLFVLSCRSLDRSLRATIAALTCGLISFIVADSAFCYLTLQEKYQTGSVFDTGWSLGFMVAAYGVVTLLDAGRAARVAPDTSDKSDKSDRSEETPDQSAHIQHDSLFRLLLPYVAVVFSWVLTYHVQRTREIEAVEPGVYWGAGAVAVLVVARQILALVENSRLNRRLLEAQVLIDAESRRVEAANRALDATNRMLEEQKEELIAQTEELESQQVVLEEQQEQLIVQQADLFAANEKLHEVNEQMSVALRELAEAKSQLEEANERLSRQATTDGLTGLSNHRTFQEKLAEQDQRARRYASPLSLLLLDVDKFKQYNDTYGHPAGDIVLKRVAAILKSECRATDVPARYGGEEFVLILPETDKEAALNAAERIREAIEAFSWPERSVTVSIGASTLTAQMNSQAELIAEADRALYDSKRKGRNRVTHSADALADDGFACGTSFPYTQMLQEMLAAQEEELSTAAERVKSVLVEGYDRTIESMARLLDMKDKETEGHSQRVMDLTVQLARFVGMNEEEVLYLKWGALLHDIGKMAVPDAILHKPGKLDEEEWKVMRQHPVVAYEMLSPIKFLQPALEIPYGHHEKWDGTGYPLGLAGDAIPLGARLFAVIDVWDALTSDRPYRPAWTEDKALKYLEENAGTHFDPRAVRAFLAMLEDRRTQEHDMERVVRKAA